MNNKSLEKVLKKLHKIPERIQKNVASGALRAGAVVMQKIAKEEMPKDTGNLKKQLKIKKFKQRNGNPLTTYRIGLTREGFYGFFIHEGTQFIKPIPFLTKGYELGGDQALQRMKDYMKTRVEKEIRKIKG